jgi:hypothetical protein
MKKIIYFLSGFILATAINVSFAKFESSSYDAASSVGYGYYGSTILPIAVDADGVVLVEQ